MDPNGDVYKIILTKVSPLQFKCLADNIQRLFKHDG